MVPHLHCRPAFERIIIKGEQNDGYRKKQCMKESEYDSSLHLHCRSAFERIIIKLEQIDGYTMKEGMRRSESDSSLPALPTRLPRG
eukprot:5419689-Pleurochrysis_carterae.AAC.1